MSIKEKPQFSTKTKMLRSCIGPKSVQKHVVIFGPTDSGKTSLLYQLKYNQNLNTHSTVGFNQEQIKRLIKIQDKAYLLKLFLWDLPGSDRLQCIWPSFFNRDVSGLIFVIDVSLALQNQDYLLKAKSCFWSSLDLHEEIDTCPVLFLLNKCDEITMKDWEGSLPEYFYDKFELDQIKNRSISVQPVCVLHDEGVEKSLTWLTNVLLDKQARREKFEVADVPLTSFISRTRKHIPYQEPELELEEESIVEKPPPSMRVIDKKYLDRRFAELAHSNSQARLYDKQIRKEYLLRGMLPDFDSSEDSFSDKFFEKYNLHR